VTPEILEMLQNVVGIKVMVSCVTNDKMSNHNPVEAIVKAFRLHEIDDFSAQTFGVTLSTSR
jgi:hypothetical protein